MEQKHEQIVTNTWQIQNHIIKKRVSLDDLWHFESNTLSYINFSFSLITKSLTFRHISSNWQFQYSTVSS